MVAMSKNLLLFLILLLLTSGCRRAGNGGNEFGTGDWVKAHVVELKSLKDEIRSQQTLTKLVWSDSGYLTAIYADESIEEGYVQGGDQPQFPRTATARSAEAMAWYNRLHGMGFAGFAKYEDTFIYLQQASYVALLEEADVRSREHYEKWAREQMGTRNSCMKIQDGVYICTDTF